MGANRDDELIKKKKSWGTDAATKAAEHSNFSARRCKYKTKPLLQKSVTPEQS